MEDKPAITILMATYNGGEFIEQQLSSLFEQTYQNWKLIIRDDGSTDNTLSIVNSYVSRFDNISLVINTTQETGACKNFSSLFALAHSDQNNRYIMFCDQDDIWKPEKIETTLKAMLDMENHHPEEPILIYGNFELMTSDGAFMDGQFRLKHHIALRNLLSFNFVYGCTMMLNRPLIDAIGKIPGFAINHDYWIALVASLYRSKFLHKPLLRYRQHSNNASGNTAGNSSAAERLKRNILLPEKELQNLRQRLGMFHSFYNQYKTDLSKGDKIILENYLNAFNISRFKVIQVMLNNRIFRNGFFQTLVSFLQPLLFYSQIKEQKL